MAIVTELALPASLQAAQVQRPGVIGARMTGAGFGGCTVNLVRPDSVAAATAAISAGYAAVTGITPEVFPVAAGDGARVLA